MALLMHMCILCRISQLCKDYCGVLNEESLRLNFVLVYELLDEVMVCTQYMQSVFYIILL